jgi:hypothetical protein
MYRRVGHTAWLSWIKASVKLPCRSFVMSALQFWFCNKISCIYSLTKIWNITLPKIKSVLMLTVHRHALSVERKRTVWCNNNRITIAWVIAWRNTRNTGNILTTLQLRPLVNLDIQVESNDWMILYAIQAWFWCWKLAVDAYSAITPWTSLFIIPLYNFHIYLR